MPRPDCPRCGSDLVVAAAATTPSESVLELRSGTPRVGASANGLDEWLCRVCGLQWHAAMNGDGASDQDDAVVEPAAMANPAVELQKAREERGRTLTEVATGTRIQERHLRALEEDAPLEEFPSPAYARFFLREYAEYLRLDPDPLLREFEARHEPVDLTPMPPTPVERRRPKAGWAPFIVLSAIALILIALLPSAFSHDDGQTLSPAAAALASPAHDSGHVQVSISPAREPNGVRAVLHLTDRSWVEAIGDGDVLEGSTLEAGTQVVYRARDLLQLTLGNAGGVRLRVNGEPVATGGSGDVVTFDIRWEDGEVVVERV